MILFWFGFLFITSVGVFIWPYEWIDENSEIGSNQNGPRNGAFIGRFELILLSLKSWGSQHFNDAKISSSRLIKVPFRGRFDSRFFINPFKRALDTWKCAIPAWIPALGSTMQALTGWPPARDWRRWGFGRVRWGGSPHRGLRVRRGTWIRFPLSGGMRRSVRENDSDASAEFIIRGKTNYIDHLFKWIKTRFSSKGSCKIRKRTSTEQNRTLLMDIFESDLGPMMG